MERAREVAHPRGDLLRRPRLGRLGDHVGIERERAQQFVLAGMLEAAEVDLGQRPPRDARLRGAPRDRRHPRVRILHVVHGVLHRLRGHDVQVEGLRGVDALEEKSHARDVGVDLVEDVGQRDDRARTLREPDLGAVADELHHLAQQHLGLGWRAEPERLHARLERLHLAVVVGAPDVDEVVPAPGELVAVVREVVAEIRGGPVGAHQHAIAQVAELGRPEPARAVGVEYEAAVRRAREHVDDLVALVQRAFGEPRVEVHADTRQIVADAVDDARYAPLARVFGSDVVAELARSSSARSTR